MRPLFGKFILITFSTLFLVSCGARVATVTKDIESPTFGNPTSKAQLIMYSDFQCPACIYFHEEIGKQLESDYIKTGKIGYVFKNFPLPFHKNAPDDAQAAMCAHAQGKFLEFAGKMYALEKEKDGLNVSDEERVAIAKNIGADEKQFTACLTEGNYIAKVESDMAEGQKQEIPGTPSVYLNGKLMKYDSKEAFFGMIDAELKK